MTSISRSMPLLRFAVIVIRVIFGRGVIRAFRFASVNWSRSIPPRRQQLIVVVTEKPRLLLLREL